MSLHAVMSQAPAAAPEDAVHADAIHAMYATQDATKQGALRDFLSKVFAYFKATGQSIPWAKIMQAVAVLVGGGFSPAALIQAFTILFGQSTMPAIP